MSHPQTDNNNKQKLSSQSKLQPKSSLNLGQPHKNPHQNIQYVKETGSDDNDYPASDEQKQNQINKLRDQYIQEKLIRKKQLMKIKRAEFGSSSSEEDDVGAEQSDSANSQEIVNSIEARIRDNSHLSMNIKDQTHPLLKPQQVHQLKGKQTWAQQYFIMKQMSVFLNQRQIEIYHVNKIKMIHQPVETNQYKLKISYESEEIMLAVSRDIVCYRKQKFSLHYVIFASIMTKKLEMMGLKFQPLQKNVPGVPQSIIKNCSIYGKIFKKSQILGRWEERLIVINEMGIYSYKRFNEQHSMFIAAESVKQIWSRFQIVDQNLLVVKVLHSSNTKTQFGIPVTDFMNERNWLYQFYHLGIN